MTVAENKAGTTAESVVPASSHGERFTSYDVEAFEVPGGREENWRFTPMKRLRGLHDGSAAATGEAKIETELAPEIRMDTVARDDERIGVAGVPSDRVAAQAYSSFASATVVTVPTETRASTHSTIRLNGPGEGQTAYGHLQIRAEQFAEAAIVLDHVGSGTYADNVEFVIGDGAHITVISVQDWAEDAVHVSEQHLHLGRDAQLKHIVVTLGGDVVRISPTTQFSGPGGDVEMLGLYFSDSGQHQEHRLLVDHSEPNCRSNVLYKGALQGDKAHAVWIGDVLIRVPAENTDTFELNRNLVLTGGARADSVPNLEIETGEIANAGHASTTGRFDDEQLFYLRSRGIEEEEARRLVVRGFFQEVLAKIDVDEVRQRLDDAIEAELQAIGA